MLKRPDSGRAAGSMVAGRLTRTALFGVSAILLSHFLIRPFNLLFEALERQIIESWWF